MKWQSLLSLWLSQPGPSGTKKPREASSDSSDDETECGFSKVLEVTDSHSVVSKGTDELGSCESASTTTQSTMKSAEGAESEKQDCMV